MNKTITQITTGDMMHVHGGFGAGVDYTVRISARMKDKVDADILRAALDRTQSCYPCFLVRIRKDERAFYYESNPLPVALLHTDSRIRLDSEETNHHVWAVCYMEDMIHLDFYHGITDGTGMYRVLATLLYEYCKDRYGVTDHEGIRIPCDPVMTEDILDPQDLILKDDPAAAAEGGSVSSEQPSADAPADSSADTPADAPADPPADAPAGLMPAFTLETDGGLTPSDPTIWDVMIPEDAFVRFTSANDSSPGTMVSLLMAKAIDSLYPQRDKEIVSAYVINARPMLQAPKTLHNCLGMALFTYSDRVRAMPFTRQCTVYRGMTFVQSDEDRIKAATGANAGAIRAATAASPSIEEKKKVFGQMFQGGEGLVTYLVSYTGKWKYPVLGDHMREFWLHPPNTFSLMVEIGAAAGSIFLSIQQRFMENTVREAFLRILQEHGIPYRVSRRMKSDIARFHEPD